MLNSKISVFTPFIQGAPVQSKLVQATLFALLALLLSACGGGSDTEEVPPVVSTSMLTLEVSGSGVISGDDGAINCDSNCSATLDQDSQVELTVSPKAGYQFEQWNGACSGSGSCSVMMNSDKTVAAVFVAETIEPVTYSLSVSLSGSGQVLSDPAGITCGSDCSSEYQENTEVALQATAAEGFVFEGWDGACAGDTVCNVTLTGNTQVNATFNEVPVPQDYELTVSVSGQGSITSSPSGINCGSDCTESYQQDSQISLIATPAAGYEFDRWAGGCNGSGDCDLIMTQARSVTAIFVETGAQSGILIADYSAPNDAFQLGEMSTNASGITWHEGLQQYLVVRNGSATIYRYDENFAFLGQFSISSINSDTEGLGFVGGNEVMVVTELNYAHKLLVEEFSGNINGSYSQTQGYRLLPRPPSNKGLEGVTVRKASGQTLARVYACQEGTASSSSALMKVVYFDMPAQDPMELLSYDSNLTVVEPFDAEEKFAGVVTDIAGMVFDDRSGHLIIVSQESRKAIQVDPDTGAIISQLALTGAPQFEGVTIGPNGELVFVSEGNWIRIYTLN